MSDKHRKQGKLHLALRALLLVAPVMGWLQLSTAYQRMACTGTLVYALLEAGWYRYWTGKWFTTVYQAFVNLLCLTVTVYAYQETIPFAPVRILLYPFNAWLLEIVSGYYLMYIFGKNHAWHYEDEWSYCHGNVSLACFFRWIALGAVQETLYPAAHWLCV